MQKLLTIVVPVYKVEKYISKCLDSLILPVEQMEKLEVIIVNDGTPDNSALIAKGYEKRYPDVFQVIDKENGGHGSAWNKGVEIATGRFIRFLDSDDWITNLSLFLTKLEKFDDVDVVFTDMIKYVSTSNSEKEYRIIGLEEDTIYDSNSFEWNLTNPMLESDALFNFQYCTYKTELLKSSMPVFLEKQYYDDEILYVLPLVFSRKCVYFNLFLYHYYIGRPGQTVDPKVYAKGYAFKMKVREQMQEQSNRYYDLLSEGKKKKLDIILNTRNAVIMKLISLMPYSEGKEKSKEFLSWIEKNHPNYHRSRRIQLCKFSFFWFRLGMQFVKNKNS